MGTKKPQTAGNRLSSPGVRRGTYPDVNACHCPVPVRKSTGICATCLGDLPPLQVVTELELVEITTMRLSTEALAKSLKKAQDDLEAKEAGVITRLKNGAMIQGQMTAHVGQETGRASPSWKTEHVDHMVQQHGWNTKEIESAVLAKYPGKTKDVLVIGN